MALAQINHSDYSKPRESEARSVTFSLSTFYVSAVFFVWFGVLRLDLKYVTLADLEFVVFLLQAMYFAGSGFHGGSQFLS